MVAPSEHFRQPRLTSHHSISTYLKRLAQIHNCVLARSATQSCRRKS